VWADGKLGFGSAYSKVHHKDILQQMIDNGQVQFPVQNYVAGQFIQDDFHGPQLDQIRIVWQGGKHPTTGELRYQIQQELNRTSRLSMYSKVSYTSELEKWVYVRGYGGNVWEDLEFSQSAQDDWYRENWAEDEEDPPDYSDALVSHLETLGSLVGLNLDYKKPEDWQKLKAMLATTPYAMGLYDSYKKVFSGDYFNGCTPQEVNEELFYDEATPEGGDLRDSYGKVGADVEDTEPAGVNVGFLHDPHKELYPNLFRGGKVIPKDVRDILKNHVLEPLSQEFDNPDSFIYFTIYGSGISYNWDESGDLDLQLWVDLEKYSATANDPLPVDDLLADIRRIVQMVNFPSFNELGLTDTGTATEDTTGVMLIQYYPKPGKGTKEENLASQPYACYDLETDKWLVKPKPIRPKFYGENFLLLMPKAKDIALQTEALLGEYQRNILNWQFWYAMWSRYKKKEYKDQYKEAMDDATQEKEGIKVLFQGVFGGRAEAYSPEGQGIMDERDMLQKLLEVWGIFQDLKHFARAPLPWEEQDMPLPTSSVNLQLIPGGGDSDRPRFKKDDQVTGAPGSDREGIRGYIIYGPDEDGSYGVQWYPIDSDMELRRDNELIPYGYTGPRRMAATHEDILYHGGGTFYGVFDPDLKPSTKDHGYWVSVQGQEYIIPKDDLNMDVVLNYADHAITEVGEYIGAWIDQAKVYLDVTKWFPDLQEAIQFGEQNHQLAIWDIANQTEIPLATTPRTAALRKLAVWSDIMEKAKRLRDTGKVQITNNLSNHVVGQVEGDHGTYNTEIWRDDPNSGTISLWNCDCPWSQYSWGRTRQWKKYEGRPCAHTLALYWTALATPVADENQQTLPGTTAPGQSPQQPSPLDLPNALQQTIPPQMPQSQPVVPSKENEQLTISFPGALSKWRKEGAFMNGDIVRVNQKVEGWDDRETMHSIQRNTIGEVIWSDDEETICIFSLNSGMLGPHNVRVTAPTSAFTLMPRTRGVAPRRQ